MLSKRYLLTNPSIVLRQEFDDQAVLFDPDSGNAFGLTRMGIFIWKRLDGRHSLEEILEGIRYSFNAVPDEAENQLLEFVRALVEKGLVLIDSREAPGAQK